MRSLRKIIYGRGMFFGGKFLPSSERYHEVCELSSYLGKLGLRSQIFGNLFSSHYRATLENNTNHILRNASLLSSYAIFKQLWGTTRIVFNGDKSNGKLEKEIQEELKNVAPAILRVISDAIDFGVGYVHIGEDEVTNIPTENVFHVKHKSKDSFIIDRANGYSFYGSKDVFDEMADDGLYHIATKIDTDNLNEDGIVYLSEKIKTNPITYLDLGMSTYGNGCAGSCIHEIRALNEILCMTKKAQKLEVLPPYLIDESQIDIKTICPNTLYATHDGVANIRAFTEARGTNGANFVAYYEAQIRSSYLLTSLFDQNGAPTGIMSTIAEMFFDNFIKEFLTKLFATKKYRKILDKYPIKKDETYFYPMSIHTSEKVANSAAVIIRLLEAIQAGSNVSSELTLLLDIDTIYRKMLPNMPEEFLRDKKVIAQIVKQAQQQAAIQQQVASKQ